MVKHENGRDMRRNRKQSAKEIPVKKQYLPHLVVHHVVIYSPFMKSIGRFGVFFCIHLH